MKFFVLHSIRAAGRTVRTPRLAVLDVPDKTKTDAVIEALDTAGRGVEFSDGGVPWGNHEVKSETQTLKEATVPGDLPSVNWKELTETKTVRRVTLRLDPADYAACVQAARKANKSIQVWCVDTLTAAAQKES